MGSSSNSLRLISSQKSVHQILGGGFIADVILWRSRNVTVGILAATFAAWVVFEVLGYTLLSLVSDVLLLLVSILFLWAKAAGLLNRPFPPVPRLHISEEVFKKAAVVIQSHVNMVLLAFHDIALAKDSKLFYNVAASLWFISVVGSWTDLRTLGYTSLIIVLSVPMLYEKYEDDIDRYTMLSYLELQQYEKIYAEFFSKAFNKAKKWILEMTEQLS